VPQGMGCTQVYSVVWNALPCKAFAKIDAQHQ
jgi:hypothetical protein